MFAGWLVRRGDAAAAVSVLREALARAEDTSATALELAWLLATSPDEAIADGAEAVRLARSVVGVTDEPPPEYLDVLAAALAAHGAFDEATRHAQRAAELARASNRTALAELIERRLSAYRAQRRHTE